MVDRGYRGAKNKVDCEVLLPGKALKRDNAYQRQKKRILCRKRSAIEPIIGHLKQDHRLLRSWLKGAEGDRINLLMAGCAWNLRKWMLAFFLFKKFNDAKPILLIIAGCPPLGAVLIVVWVWS